MANSAPNGFLLELAVMYIIAHMFLDNNYAVITVTDGYEIIPEIKEIEAP
nr:hypothetical protein [Butyrivibrio sp. WCE2006]